MRNNNQTMCKNNQIMCNNNQIMCNNNITESLLTKDMTNPPTNPAMIMIKAPLVISDTKRSKPVPAFEIMLLK